MSKRSTSLINSAAAILGGSAVAGFGFSFGRDVYKKTKSNAQEIILALLAIGILLGTYLAGLWLFRNYKSIQERILYAVYSALAILPGAFAAFVLFPVKENTPKTLFFSILLILAALFAIGSIVAFFQRSKRSRVWEIEAKNEIFLQQHELIQIDDEVLRDNSIRQNYRIEQIDKGGISLFALGRRNKRGYIEMDEHGRFVHYSGLFSI